MIGRRGFLSSLAAAAAAAVGWRPASSALPTKIIKEPGELVLSDEVLCALQEGSLTEAGFPARVGKPWVRDRFEGTDGSVVWHDERGDRHEIEIVGWSFVPATARQPAVFGAEYLEL